jgi:hypothetical protein
MESAASNAEGELRPAIDKLEKIAAKLHSNFASNIEVLKQRIRQVDSIVIDDKEGFL